MRTGNGVIEVDNEEEILEKYLESFREKYGDDFLLKQDSVLEFLLKIAANHEKILQENIKYLAEQFDTTKTEGVWQDVIFSRLGLKRSEPKYTHFELTLSGAAGGFAEANSVIIRDKITGEEFYNDSNVTFLEDGESVVRFRAKNFGQITPSSISGDENFSIVTAPNSVVEILSGSLANLVIGDEGESDEDFSARYKTSKGKNFSSTKDAVFSSLSNYVDTPKYLKILTKSEDITMDAGYVKIIAKPNVPDNIFAGAILDTIADGIGLVGDCEVVLKDDLGVDVLIKFSHAVAVEIGIKVEIFSVGNEISDEKISEIKNKIFTTVTEKKYGLSSTIYATEIVEKILDDNLVNVDVFRVLDGVEVKKLELNTQEFPTFSLENIDVKTLNK